MYEVSMQELSVFVVLGFTAGVFTSFYLTRLFEVVHMWRLLREVIAHLLLMCLGIIEDIEFLKELKKKQMHESVILSLVTKVPRNFRSMMPFNNWHEAMAFLRTELRALGGEE